MFSTDVKYAVDEMPLVVEPALPPDPSGDNRVTLMEIHPCDDDEPFGGFCEAYKLGTESLKEVVAQHFKGGGWKSDKVIQGVINAGDFYASEWAQARTPLCTKDGSC